MPYHLAIILNNEMLYCSSELNYSKFELAIFTHLLMNQVNPELTWHLHKLILSPLESSDAERLLVKDFYERELGVSLQICLLGPFSKGAAYGYRLLESFFNQFKAEFPPERLAKELSEDDKEEIAILGELMASSLFGADYEKIVEESTYQEEFHRESAVAYLGMSTTDGVPIVSKVYDQGIELLGVMDEERKTYVNSVLSGQLATIIMNGIIRAQCHIKSIQVAIEDSEYAYLFFHFINFGRENNYMFESISIGNPFAIQNNIAKIKEKLNQHPISEKPFTGQLKEYRPLILYFDQFLGLNA